MTPDIIAAIISSVLGSGATGTVAAWIIRRAERRRNAITKNELDAALADSPVLQDISAKLDRDFQRINRLELAQLRAELFAHTLSKNQHERQIEAAREYLQRGGNGAGHIRADELRDDYRRRLDDDDWRYL